MAAPGRETEVCEEGEKMGNNRTSFAVVVGGSGSDQSKLPKDNGG
jgi:hypothetical protein